MSLTLRIDKGSELTFAEMDGNFTYLEDSSNSRLTTSSFNAFTGSASVTGSFTGSFAGDGSELTGVTLEGTQYVFVTANGTDSENAVQLQDAYDTAQTMSPSASNRVKVICGPGNYNFSTDFVMDVQYIDLVSLDGNRSVIFNGTGTISITANDVFVKGVDTLAKNFTVATNLTLLKVENCVGGDFSFAGAATASGTFINCTGGDASFGGSFPGTASGIFTNCVGGVGSFGSGNNRLASGTFTNCVGGDTSFGGSGGIASGTFTNCVSGFSSFGYNGTASGTFTDCKGGDNNFGGNGTASGVFTNCQGGNGAFGADDGLGGTGTLTGKLYYCRLTSGTFQTVSLGGITRLCIDGNDLENNQG